MNFSRFLQKNLRKLQISENEPNNIVILLPLHFDDSEQFIYHRAGMLAEKRKILT